MKTNAGSGAATDESREASSPTRADPLPTDVDGLPDLPAAFDDALDPALARLGVTLRPDARTAIESQARLLLAWTTHINLTAIRDPRGIAIDHVADSLTALAILREEGTERLLDIGSGGGYPGLPLVAATPSGSGVMVDAIAKKARFLRAAIAVMGLEPVVEVIAERAEALAATRAHRGRWPIVTARAVGDLGQVAALGLPLLAVGGLLIVWKREPVAAEVAAAAEAIARLGGGEVRVRPAGLSERPANVLVTIRRVRPVARGPGRRSPRRRRVESPGRRLR
jgi:16S rRNA (guanine527-N7)-methyltransferase